MKSDFGYLNYKCLKTAIAYKRARPLVRTADLYKWTTTYTIIMNVLSVFLFKIAMFFCQTDDAGGESRSEGSQHFTHLTWDFIKDDKIRDINKLRPDDPNYNPRTLHIPKDFKDKQTPAMRQWFEMKAHNYDVVLFFKVGKFYELYHMDAVTGVNELGLIFMKVKSQI